MLIFFSVNYRQLAVNFIVNMVFLFLKQDLLVIQTSTDQHVIYY